MEYEIGCFLKMSFKTNNNSFFFTLIVTGLVLFIKFPE
ncbi:Uncharacterised protein [Mycobacterium tuberculosis]|nr:Uncharacterised protein [Mycobacterium tuberculosis]